MIVMTHVRFHRPINRMMSELLNELPVVFKDATKVVSAVPVNIIESNDAYRIDVIAPGFEKTELKVALEDKILTITGQRKAAEEKNEQKVIRQEFRYPDFKRSFTIDENIDATSIEASHVNGVLSLNLPKRKEVKEATKEITIN